MSLSNLSAQAAHQYSLLKTDGYEKHRRLYRFLDRIRERFGFSADGLARHFAGYRSRFRGTTE